MERRERDRENREVIDKRGKEEERKWKEEEERMTEGRGRNESFRNICLIASLPFLFSELECSH